MTIVTKKKTGCSQQKTLTAVVYTKTWLTLPRKMFDPERNHPNLEDTFTLIISQARPGKDLKGCFILSQ